MEARRRRQNGGSACSRNSPAGRSPRPCPSVPPASSLYFAFGCSPLPSPTTNHHHHSTSTFSTNVDPLANAFFISAPFFVSCDSIPRGPLLRLIHWYPTASSLSRLVLPSSYKPFASPRRIPLQHCSGVSSSKSRRDPLSRACLTSRFPNLPSSPLLHFPPTSGRDYTSSSSRPVPFV